MKITKAKTVAFTGNRTITTSDDTVDRNLENVIRTELSFILEELYEEGKTCYLNGGAIGFDLLAAEEVLKLRVKHPDVQLIIVVPFMGQELRYIPVDKLRYAEILQQADDKILIWEGGYNVIAYHKRNDFLVENSSEIIAYSNGIGHGAGSTVRKAEAKGVKLLNIFDELQAYFAIQHPAKAFLQDYSDIPSFRYGRNGVIFQGCDQPYPIAFGEIEKIEQKGGTLLFFLKDGQKIFASLTSDECSVLLTSISGSC